MNDKLPRTRRCGLFLAGMVVGLGLVQVFGWAPTPPMSTETEDIDVRVLSVPIIPPGTEISDHAPYGWTRLVLRSHLRVADKYETQVSDTVKHMAALLFTVTVARVASASGRHACAHYQLADVAMGVGCQVGGKFLVLSNDSQDLHGADLNFVDRKVLSAGEEGLKKSRCIARSPTFMMTDSPSFLFHEGKHLEIDFRYAYLVDARTGDMETLVWALASDRKEGDGPLRPIEWLPPDAVQDCPLNVKLEEFVLGFPTSKKAFAVVRLPQGKRTLQPSAQVAMLLGLRPPLREEDARRIEGRLWELLREGGE